MQAPGGFQRQKSHYGLLLLNALQPCQSQVGLKGSLPLLEKGAGAQQEPGGFFGGGGLALRLVNVRVNSLARQRLQPAPQRFERCCWIWAWQLNLGMAALLNWPPSWVCNMHCASGAISQHCSDTTPPFDSASSFKLPLELADSLLVTVPFLLRSCLFM